MEPHVADVAAHVTDVADVAEVEPHVAHVAAMVEVMVGCSGREDTKASSHIPKT